MSSVYFNCEHVLVECIIQSDSTWAFSQKLDPLFQPQHCAPLVRQDDGERHSFKGAYHDPHALYFMQFGRQDSVVFM